jgi:hypothetical protein
MDAKQCNGWTNYATWRINLEILGDTVNAEDLQEVAEDFVDFNDHLDDMIQGFKGRRRLRVYCKMEKNQIELAKDVLRDAGYYVDNLWQVDDVRKKFKNVDNETCQEVLDIALTDDWLTENTWETICVVGTEVGLTFIND